MKEYQQAVHQEHMPKVSVEKKRELESLMQNSGNKPLQRPQNPVQYNPQTYKTLDPDSGRGDSSIQRSVDWSKHKNPLVQQPKQLPEFVKIDYLRFDNKSEVLAAMG